MSDVITIRISRRTIWLILLALLVVSVLSWILASVGSSSSGPVSGHRVPARSSHP